MFSSEPFCSGDEGQQRLLIKPLGAVTQQQQQQPAPVAEQYSILSRQEVRWSPSAKARAPRGEPPRRVFKESPRGEPPMESPQWRAPNGEPPRSPEEPHVNMNMRPNPPPC